MKKEEVKTKEKDFGVCHAEFQGFGDYKNGAAQWLLEKQI